MPKQFRRDLGLEAAAPLAVLPSLVAFFYLGPRQSRFVALCGAALQTGPDGGCSRWGGRESVVLHAERVRSTDELIAHYRRPVELADPDAAGIRRYLAEAMGRLTGEGPGRRRGQEKQDAGLRLPAQL